jgi:phospholipase/carboxylesterase
MAELKFVKNFDEPSTNPILFFLHGLGANEQDLIPAFDKLLPELKYVSVRAPIDLKSIVPGGYAWSDLPRRIETTLYEQTTYSDEMEHIFAQSEHGMNLILELVDEIVPSSTKIIPIGFSQGAMEASELVRNAPEKLAAAVILSGYLHPKPQPKDDSISELPVFVGYGDADNVLPQTYLEDLAEFMASHTKADVKVYPGQVHTISEEELNDVGKFLRQIVN